MPDRKRYQRLKEQQAFDELSKKNPPAYLAELRNRVDPDFDNLLKEIKADEGRRVAAYAGEANAKRAAQAALRLAEFAATHEDLILQDLPARRVAYLIDKREAKGRSLEAIAIYVRKARDLLRRRQADAESPKK